MRTQDNPETVVQRQLDAYNTRDIEKLMATYAEDAQQFQHPDTLLADGVEQIRERSIVRFREPNLHAILLKRIVSGDVVVDHERVARTFPEGERTIELIAIYKVSGGRISKAWFISGTKTLN